MKCKSRIAKLAVCTSLVSALSGCASVSHWMTRERTSPPAQVQTIQENIMRYQVLPGDTLLTVSQKFRVTERALIIWNHLESPYTLNAGQVIWVNDPDSANPANKPLAGTHKNMGHIVHSSEPAQGMSSVTVSAPKFVVEKRIESQSKPSSIQQIAPQQVNKTSVASLEKAAEKMDKPIHQFETYIVQSGDTALGVAFQHDMTLDQLVEENKLQKPYELYIGQKLKVFKVKRSASTAVQTKAATETQVQTPKKKPVSSPPLVSESKVEKVESAPVAKTKDVSPVKNNTANASEVNVQKDKTPTAPDKPKTIEKISNGQSVDVTHGEWRKPLPNLTVIGTGDSGETLYQGTAGEAVHAVQAGDVLYQGVGTLGYGEMVIINHKGGYLTAYRNLESTTVAEGQTIQAGDIIGQVGQFKGKAELGFEIRKDGAIVPPQTLLK